MIHKNEDTKERQEEYERRRQKRINNEEKKKQVYQQMRDGNDIQKKKDTLNEVLKKVKESDDKRL